MFKHGQLAKLRVGKWEDAFTLVELMVVVVLISILVGIAIPIYNSITEGAEQSAVEANLRTIDSAIMQLQALGCRDLDLDEGIEAVSDLLEPIDPAAEEDYDIELVGEGDREAYRGVVCGEAGGQSLDGEYLAELPWRNNGN